jgi:hypothetical protein
MTTKSLLAELLETFTPEQHEKFEAWYLDYWRRLEETWKK